MTATLSHPALVVPGSGRASDRCDTDRSLPVSRSTGSLAGLIGPAQASAMERSQQRASGRRLDPQGFYIRSKAAARPATLRTSGSSGASGNLATATTQLVVVHSEHLARLVRDRSFDAIAEARGGRRRAAVRCCFQRRACSEAGSQLAIRTSLLVGEEQGSRRCARRSCFPLDASLARLAAASGIGRVR